MTFSTTPTEGNDRLRATAANQTINALGGNDWLTSVFDESTLYGGNGNDRLNVTLSLLAPVEDDFTRTSTLYGGNGNDWLDSVFSANRIDDPEEPSFQISSIQSGGSGNDNIFITALGGSEFFPSGSFDFEVYGGSGSDNIWVEVSGDALSSYNLIEAGSGADSVYVAYDGGGDFGGSKNDIYAGADDDDIFVSSSVSWATSADNSVWGEEGNDRLEAIASGFSPTNRLFGGEGNDTLIATGYGAGDPTAYVTNSTWGGAGNDTIELNGIGQSLFSDVIHTAYGDEGDDTITSTIRLGTQETGEAHSASAELYGGTGNDVITASTIFSAEDEVTGGASLYGQAGNDTLRVYGGVENLLDGGNGDDTITGGTGEDRIIGGSGADALRGGAGNDSFVFLWAAGGTPDIRDTIFDFGIGTAARGDDVIDVSAIDANVNRGGNQSFTFGGTGVGRLWVEDDPDSASSLVMANNGGAQMLVIAVQDWASRDASDWVRGDFVL